MEVVIAMSGDAPLLLRRLEFAPAMVKAFSANLARTSEPIAVSPFETLYPDW